MICLLLFENVFLYLVILPRFCVNNLSLLHFLNRSEWRLQHHGPLRVRADASSRVRLHHAQSHGRSGELPLLLTHTRGEEDQSGQTEKVRLFFSSCFGSLTLSLTAMKLHE